jgi:hypothetical protein
MRIDWSETLIGAEGAMRETGNRSVRHALIALRLARLVGIGGAALLVSLALALMAARSPQSLPFLMATSGLLLANVIGFVAVERFGTRGAKWLIGIAGCALVPVSFFNPAIAAAMIAILACEALWLREAIKRRREWQLALPVAASAAAFLALIGSEFTLRGTLLLAVALLPVLVAAWRYHHHELSERSAAQAERGKDAALVALALARLPQMRLICDVSGRVDEMGEHASFSRHLAGEALGNQISSLIDRVLIADRPAMLQALSRAIHHNEASEGLVIRLQAGEGIGAMPPNFLPHRLDCVAAPGVVARAIVLIEPIEAPVDTAVLPDAPAQRERNEDSELLARAFHDSVSPFNAGLGYLEMIADPRLAPHDLSVFRHYAREAMGAVREAHRNASLMGRWIKLDQAQTIRVDRADLGELTGDAIRALHHGGEGGQCEIRLDETAVGISANVPLEATRFALAVYLRGLVQQANRAGRITVFGRIEGRDIEISALIEPQPKAQTKGDMFQLALERAASRFGDYRFARRADGTSLLVIEKAQAAATVVAATKLAS